MNYNAVKTAILIGSQVYGDCSMFKLNFHMYDTAITTSLSYIWELVYSIATVAHLVFCCLCHEHES